MFLSVSIPIDFSQAQQGKRTSKSIELTDCLNTFSKEEFFGDNCWFCTKCNKHANMRRKAAVFIPPQVLIVYLKRFRQDSHGIRHKITATVQFPSNLDLTPFMTSKQTTNYNLFAVINHAGIISSGHSLGAEVQATPSFDWLVELPLCLVKCILEFELVEMSDMLPDTPDMKSSRKGQISAGIAPRCPQGSNHRYYSLVGRVFTLYAMSASMVIVPEEHPTGRQGLSIDPEVGSLRYTTVDDLSAAVAKLGQGAVIAKIDIEARWHGELNDPNPVQMAWRRVPARAPQLSRGIISVFRRKDNSSIVMHLVMYALFDGNEKCGRLSDGINGTVYVHVVVLHSASNGDKLSSLYEQQSTQKPHKPSKHTAKSLTSVSVGVGPTDSTVAINISAVAGSSHIFGLANNRDCLLHQWGLPPLVEDQPHDASIPGHAPPLQPPP
eukprot:Em0010g696a